MTATQFKTALRKLDLSVYAARKVLGVSLRQAYRYSTGEAEIPVTVARLMTMLAKYGVPEDWQH